VPYARLSAARAMDELAPTLNVAVRNFYANAKHDDDLDVLLPRGAAWASAWESGQRWIVPWDDSRPIAFPWLHTLGGVPWLLDPTATRHGAVGHQGRGVPKSRAARARCASGAPPLGQPLRLPRSSYSDESQPASS
jgi:hypothetical protein